MEAHFHFGDCRSLINRLKVVKSDKDVNVGGRRAPLVTNREF